MKPFDNIQLSKSTDDASKELQSEVVWNMPGYVLFKNTDSIFVGANKQMAHLMGYDTLESLIGNTDHDIRYKIPGAGAPLSVRRIVSYSSQEVWVQLQVVR